MSSIAPIMPLADTFQEIVDSLPSDWTDLELDLRVQEDRYIDAATLLVHVQRAALLAATTGTGGSSSPTSSATPRPRPPSHGTLKLLDDAGHRRRARAARAAHRPRRDDADVGPPGVRAAGVPPPARAVDGRASSPLFDDLLLGSNVLGMLRAAGHEAQLAGGAEQSHPDGAAVLIVDLGSAGFDGVAVVEAPAGRAASWGTRARSASTRTSTSTRKRRADAAGFDLVVPRSRMAREGAALVERLAQAPGAR